ncbi:carbon-nitrogen hydrolase family protein [Nocardioides terrisoli]|uniref:carbon-nitrogen hydrolase family protein n=1 Tax=Nocardioides terrisoli TaxID=3388267 RepID=UPI00287B5E06|nr:carbon-nitrogen hydrolase family protein [Nocardioides marmorisolisilvae]
MRDSANSPLSVTLVQAAAGLVPEANRDRLKELVAGRSGLVVLPEAYARDFGRAGTQVGPFAEPLDGPFVEELTKVAGDATVVAGMFEVSGDPERPFNTLVVVDRAGLRASYRKIHLYDAFGYRESDRLSAGVTSPVSVEVGGITVGLMTCYDLRFPELGRALVDRGSELIVVSAAWLDGPHKIRHWWALLAARAIENTVYVAAAAQPAPRYGGYSALLDPYGQTLASAGPGEGQVIGEVDQRVIALARSENPSLNNRRM